MIYEMRTETLRPGAVPEYEQRFEEKLASREKHSKLGAFWHTVIGPLNQVIHVWPYEDLAHRARVRVEAAQEPGWPPQVDDLTMNVQAEVMSPAPFMKPLGNRQLGNIYEMRIYSYIPGGIPHVVQRWVRVHRIPGAVLTPGGCVVPRDGASQQVVPPLGLQGPGGARVPQRPVVEGPPLACADLRMAAQERVQNHGAGGFFSDALRAGGPGDSP